MSFVGLSVGSLSLKRNTRATERPAACEIVDLADVPAAAWSDLAGRAVEPNAFFLPAWAQAVNAHAADKGGARALLAWECGARTRLLGVLPVVSAWRALKLPIPMLVAWQAYAPLTTPLLDRMETDAAARGLLEAAARAGASALLLPSIASDGAAAEAMRRAVASQRGAPRMMNRHMRAQLDATQEAEAMFKSALGSKKLKELRRQRNRLADAGEVTSRIVRQPDEVAAALEDFLKLEDAGWKGARGTALAKDSGDTVFIREALAKLSASGHAEIVTLSRGDEAVAAGLVLRHGRRGYFFKIAYDETAAKMSPGVQLTMDLTRALCADPSVDGADSIAVADHPMIDHVWRDRIAIADMLAPTRPGSVALESFAAMISARHAARTRVRNILHAIRSR